MTSMQYEQPRGLASAAQQYQYQHQYLYPQPLPQPNAGQSPSNYTELQPARPVNESSSLGGPTNPAYQSQSPLPYDDEHPPPVPQRHESHAYNGQAIVDFQYQQSNHTQTPQAPHEQTPPLPPRSQYRGNNPNLTSDINNSQMPNMNEYIPPLPPQRIGSSFAADDDPSNPIHYARDPHKLVAYLVPFPKPQIAGIDPNQLPTRFLIYTPPPPPLTAPKEGEKEGKIHKVQRKWQQEVRSAKTSDAKVNSWKGVKSRATKAIAWGVNQTTTSNLEFLGRVNNDSSASDSSTPSSPTADPSTTTKKTVGVNEMLLVYPPSIGLTDETIRTEFVNTMLRTKSKSQRDAIIATGLLPVSFGIDIMATLIWPFGGLGEIDSVWLYSSVRGAKTAHSVTKRLSSSGEDTLQLNFTPSARLDVLQRYLDAECHRTDPKLFPGYKSPPTESDVLEAIGWSPAQNGGEQRNWEDEQWEVTEVKDDVKSNMHKGAKEWRKFCLAYAKDPEKAMKKK